MALTPAQQATLKTHIDTSPDLNLYPNNTDGNAAVTALLNLVAAPTFIVWKNLVIIGDVGRAFNAAELAGLTQINHTRLQTLAIYLAGGVSPYLPSLRQFFDDIFSGAGGTQTRAALLVLWKRSARRVEQVLAASGTGSDAAPATLGFDGPISAADVEAARNS